jgi:hypothetical protein
MREIKNGLMESSLGSIPRKQHLAELLHQNQASVFSLLGLNHLLIGKVKNVQTCGLNIWGRF